MTSFVRDLRFGLRTLAKSPGFVAVVTLTLALGIATNVSIFALTKGMILEALPYREADRLAHLWESRPSRGWTDVSISAANYDDWTERQHAFEAMALYQFAGFNVSTSGEPERVGGVRTTVNLFEVTGRPPSLGRSFTVDDVASDEPVVVLSHSFWNESFGLDPDVLGTKLLLDGEPHTVIGVLPPEAAFPPSGRLWVASDFASERQERGSRSYAAVARLADGTTLDAAQADMERVAAELEAEYPDHNSGWSVTVQPILDELLGEEIYSIFTILTIAVGFVVLIVCANVANLLLARGVSREKEMSLRVTMGAERGRLLRQLLSENALLAGAGGAVGLALTPLAIRALLQIAPADAPRLDNVTLDGTVVAYTVGLALVTALVFGLAPALAASRPNLNESLKEGGRRGSGGGSHRLLRGLVATEVALAFALTATGVLMTRSIQWLGQQDPGLDPAGKLTARLTLTESTYPESSDQIGFYRAALERISEIPGVEAVAATQSLPLSGSNSWRGFHIEGRPWEAPDERESVGYLLVHGRYFETLGIPTVRGRTFVDSDLRDDTAVIVVNRTMAEQYWPGESVLGKRVSFASAPPDDDAPSFSVVGVVADVRHRGFGEPARPEVYVPYPAYPSRGMNLVVATTMPDPAQLAPALRNAIRDVDPNQPLYDVMTMETVVAQRYAAERAVTQVLGALGIGGLLLAAIGIYGVVAFAVSQRRHEIGIRRAIGARRSDIISLSFRQAMTPIAIGLAVGLGLALALGRGLSSILAGISAADPRTYLLAIAALAGAAALATLVPARRAARVDPLEVLRDG